MTLAIPSAARRTAAASRMSPCHSSSRPPLAATWASRRDRWPRASLSRLRTTAPRPSRPRTSALPMKPVPPVTRKRVPSSFTSASRGGRGQGYGLGSALQIGGFECVLEPAKIGGQPANHLEATLSGLPFVPLHRDLADAPTETMALHQKLDAVGESFGRLQRHRAKKALGEKTEAVGGIVRREPRHAIEDLRRASHDGGLEQRATYHLAARNEATGADDVAPLAEAFDHGIESWSVVVVVGGKDQDGRGRALREAGDHRAEGAFSAVFDANHGTARVVELVERGQGVVVVAVVADEDAEGRLHVLGERSEHGANHFALLVDRDDDV